jgi:hypothetical protein
LSVNEDAHLLAGHATFESRYNSVRHDIEQNQKRYEFNERIDWDEVQKTAAKLAEADKLLLRVDTCETATRLHDACSSEEFYDFGQDIGVSAASTSAADELALSTRMTDIDFRNEARRLIWNQLRYLYHIMHLYRYRSGKPFHEFLTGGVGTGKTVALRVIAEAIN